MLTNALRFHRLLYYTAIVFMTLALSPSVLAQSSSPDNNSGFTYQSNPISAACVDVINPFSGNEPHSATLKKCSATQQKTESMGNGWYQIEYKDESHADDNLPGRTPFFRYKVLYRYHNSFIVSTLSNGGGTGYFTTLLSIRYHNNKLSLEKQISPIGDRCNGGISDEYVQNHYLYYGVNLTPPDIVSYSNNDDLTAKLSASDDSLEYSASSCVATAYYKYDLAKRQSEFAYIKLPEQTLNNRIGWTNHYKYQACFNQLLNTYITAKKLKWKQTDIDKFTKKFQQQCVT